MGLLLLRLAAGVAMLADGTARLQAGLPAGALLFDLLAMAAAVLLIAGLWTPISASLVAVFGMWQAISQASEFRSAVLLSTIGIGLALLGPGIWSVDSRLFGWRRIDLHEGGGQS